MMETAQDILAPYVRWLRDRRQHFVQIERIKNRIGRCDERLAALAIAASNLVNITNPKRCVLLAGDERVTLKFMGENHAPFIEVYDAYGELLR
jgi:hypothetical protein